jgi:hypothetical protein
MYRESLKIEVSPVRAPARALKSRWRTGALRLPHCLGQASAHTVVVPALAQDAQEAIRPALAETLDDGSSAGPDCSSPQKPAISGGTINTSLAAPSDEYEQRRHATRSETPAAQTSRRLMRSVLGCRFAWVMRA